MKSHLDGLLEVCANPREEHIVSAKLAGVILTPEEQAIFRALDWKADEPERRANELEELTDYWECRLKEDGLKLIEHTAENGITYIHGQRPGGRRMYPLDDLDGYNAELQVDDEYFTSKDTKQQFDQVLAQAMVRKLPRAVKVLGEKKCDNIENWTRQDGQRLRRYTQYLTYEKLEVKARIHLIQQGSNEAGEHFDSLKTLPKDFVDEGFAYTSPMQIHDIPTEHLF